MANQLLYYYNSLENLLMEFQLYQFHTFYDHFIRILFSLNKQFYIVSYFYFINSFNICLLQKRHDHHGEVYSSFISSRSQRRWMFLSSTFLKASRSCSCLTIYQKLNLRTSSTLWENASPVLIKLLLWQIVVCLILFSQRNMVKTSMPTGKPWRSLLMLLRPWSTKTCRTTLM